jgi:hypothetical protein
MNTTKLFLQVHMFCDTQQNYFIIFLMSMDVKILNKIFTNQIQQALKHIIHHDQISFIPGVQG